MAQIRAIFFALTVILLLPPAGHAVDREDQIGRWVEELNASEYEVRDRATQNLIAAGRAAVEPLKGQLDSATLEFATRTVFILQELAVGGDASTEDAARDVLIDIARPRVTPAARQASDALLRLDERRQQRALEELADLGARVIEEYREFGESEFSPTRLAVEIGEEWRGKPQDLERLRWLYDVQQVNFIGPAATESGLQHVADMEQVYFVKIARSEIGDSALRHLKSMPQLRAVKLIYVPIGDAGAEQLRLCPRVRSVFAYGTKISDTGKQRLTDRGVYVDLKRGAFLGIAVTSRNEDWSITTVTPNSAAERAGLLPGDVVLRYGSQRVTDFKSLQDMIAKNVGGDTVRLQVLRRGKVLERQVTFGEWK